MRLVIALLIGIAAWGQQYRLDVHAQPFDNDMLKFSNMEITAGSTVGEICRITGQYKLIVAPGKAEACWAEVVKAHDTASLKGPHANIDCSFELIRLALHKPPRPCVWAVRNTSVKVQIQKSMEGEQRW